MMAQLGHEKLKKMVENAADLTQEARDASERDADYYHGHQWTAEEIAVLQQRKQPVTTINRIKRKIDAMVGIEQQGRSDPRAYPRNPQDSQAADAATKALMFVDDSVRFDAKRSAAFEDLNVYGIAGVEVGVEQKRGQYEVAINRIRWEEIFFDPHSREKDMSDAGYIGRMRWMSLDTALELYGGTVDEDKLSEMLDASMTSTETGETYDDRPDDNDVFRWADKRQKRVRVAEMYYKRGGKWYHAIFCGGGEIHNDVSVYVDEDGQPACAFIMMTAYIDRDNRRYGVVRDMISAQDEINKRRSKLLHQLNSRQTIGVKGAVESVAGMKREMGSPDGHVELVPEAMYDAAQSGVKPFEIVQNQDQVAGQFNLLVEAKSEIDLVGPNATLLGQAEGQQSGRAIMAQQQAGLAELAPIYDSLNDWTLRVYRAIWNRIKQFWTEERWVRVTDDTGAPQFIGLNVRQIMVDQITGEQFVGAVDNAVAQMDVDIVLDTAPDVVSLQQEQFEQLAKLAAQGLPIPPEMLIEASSLPGKSQLLERLKESMQQAQAMQAQAMQAQAQLEGMKTQAQAQKDMAGAAKDAATAQKTQVETAQMAAGLR